MPRKKTLTHRRDKEPFGKRLARLRRAAGYSQTELAELVGISRRMVAYYEVQTRHPPTVLLPALAQVLGVSADVLLGLEPLARDYKPSDARLRKRFQELERLPAKERRRVLEVIDALLESLRAKRGAAV